MPIPNIPSARLKPTGPIANASITPPPARSAPPPAASAPPSDYQQEFDKLSGRVQALEQVLTVSGPTVTLKSGSSTITLKPDGTILIKGKDITIEGSGKVTVKASGEMTLKGSKINQN